MKKLLLLVLVGLLLAQGIAPASAQDVSCTIEIIDGRVETTGNCQDFQAEINSIQGKLHTPATYSVVNNYVTSLRPGSASSPFIENREPVEIIGKSLYGRLVVHRLRATDARFQTGQIEANRVQGDEINLRDIPLVGMWAELDDTWVNLYDRPESDRNLEKRVSSQFVFIIGYVPNPENVNDLGYIVIINDDGSSICLSEAELKTEWQGGINPENLDLLPEISCTGSEF